MKVSNPFPVKVGVIGCGNISGIYLKNAQTFAETEVVACADLVPERAITKAVEFGVPQASTVDDVLADPKIEIILNLTVPKTHVGISLAALRAGKSVYSEKPLAVTREDGQRILAAARERNLRVGCAPDTFLGAGLQTARQLIDAGAIGQPVAATAFMVCHGHEGWHPDPEFYYQTGGGPMLDMGPYYLTALVHLLGPVRRVCGATRISFPEHTITSAPKKGKSIKVEVPTHVTGLLDFASGAIGTIITSFDVWHANLPLIEIHGATGSLSVPDPNGFGGPVRIRRAGDAQWADVPLAFNYAENSRGLGLADLAHALRTGRPHRASGDLALHVLDVMQAIHESSQGGAHINVTTTCARPAPLPTGLAPGRLDD
jgi:predicted dehydrogenase